MSMRSEHVDQMSIGELARRSRLSAKALRLYDGLGLLPPARVDEDSGYRLYAPGQLKQVRLIAALRQLQVPLGEIKAILPLEPFRRRSVSARSGLQPRPGTRPAVRSPHT
jgi:DNA-binding transcriptional MerR regulator